MKRVSKIVAYCFVIVLLSTSLTACLDEPIMLSKQDKKLIDSLYNAERKVRLVELDSICDLEFDGRVQAAIDSIMAKRLAEIQRLKGGGGQSKITIEK